MVVNIPSACDQYDFNGILGQGSSSCVYALHRRCDDMRFAGKVLMKFDQKTISEGMHEFHCMNLVSGHDSILKCHQACLVSADVAMPRIGERFRTQQACDDRGDYSTTVDESIAAPSTAPRTIEHHPRLCLVTERMAEGTTDLGVALEERGSFAEDDVRKIMKQLLSAVDYIHARGVAHRDIKLENILLASASLKVKISDFGLAAFSPTDDPTSDFAGLHQTCGTPLYVAPEVLERHRSGYGTKVDEWSCGVVMFMLLSGYPPFRGENMSMLLRKICTSNADFHHPAWAVTSSGARDLVERLLAKDPKWRLSAREALQHSWLLQADASP